MVDYKIVARPSTNDTVYADLYTKGQRELSILMRKQDTSKSLLETMDCPDLDLTGGDPDDPDSQIRRYISFDSLREEGIGRKIQGRIPKLVLLWLAHVEGVFRRGSPELASFSYEFST